LSGRHTGPSSLALVFFALLLIAGSAAAGGVDSAQISGRVVRIADGDTLTVLVSGHQPVRIRLADIDAPERNQPYGRKAKQALSDLVFARDVRAMVTDHDRYGRLVARIYQGGLYVNAEMVRRGAAWAYLQYLRDPQMSVLERQARAAGRGLWGLQPDQITPPWEWRARERGGRGGFATSGPPLPSARGAAPGGYACGSKHYCREMASCAEARFYLSRCGEAQLDGNGDGVPCNRLCRR